jgi:hypothetical protein
LSGWQRRPLTAPERKSTARAADANDGLSVPSFYEAKERSDKTNGAADVILYELSGLMFWLMQKKFVGSYLAFKTTRRS